MKLIIDISEEDFEYLNQFRDIVDEIVKNKRNNGSDNINYAVLYGTQLPKGHGRLIDADALNIHRCDDSATRATFDYVYEDDIEDAPTIIEADKE